MVQFTKLRLTGFKSFVDPTELIIAPGLTGVVGPNGCGKSNLVEALRWVMGENSAKRMRGSGMEDVIFAGSATRPSRNIAEVALMLDNQDRSVSSQFGEQDELEVTRRIERGSGSNYKVNGRDLRARDVQLLFADEASGAHSAALVSQGRVGAVVNAKATDRRRLLEEAAGITGLHSRRHEAELRLRAAETNLERLDDVISTLEAQLQGLKRQVRQASRYKNLARHIRRQEAILLHIDVTAAQSAQEAAGARHQEADSQVASLTGSAAQAASEQSEAAAAMPDLRMAEAEAGAALQRLVVERENLQREESQAIAAKEQGEQRLAQIEADRERAKGQAADAAMALTRLGEERAALDADGAAEGQSLIHAREALSESESAVAESERKQDEAAAAVAEFEAAAAALERRLIELQARQERGRQELETCRAERDDLAASGAAQPASLVAAKQALADAEAALESAREAAEQSGSAHAEARNREQAARQALQDEERQHAKRRAEIEALSRVLEPAEADIWPPLVDSVTVEPGYEAALGAALGDDLNAPPDEAAPIHWQTLPVQAGAHSLPVGVIPLGAFVRGPEALTRRLSQTGLVGDALSGARLQASLRPGQRLVTREGDLWRWDGYTVKASAATAAAARLAQRNALAERRAEQAAAEPTLQALREKHEAAAQAARLADEEEARAKAALAEAFAEARGARERESSENEAAAAARSRLAALQESERRLAADIEEIESALEAANLEREALPDLAERRASLAEQRTELAQQRRDLAERQGDVERLERRAEARAERMATIERERESWQSRAGETETYCSELTRRQAEALLEIEALAGKPEEIAERRAALAEQIEAAEAKRKDAADALASGETRLAEADRALKSQEAALAEAREERVRAESAVSQAGQTLETLAARVQERLECGMDQLLEVAEIDAEDALPDRETADTRLQRLLRERDGMGPVNLRAEQEATELDEQIRGMENERHDLVSAIARLRQGIASLNREGRERLLAAFEQVNTHFSELFVRLFGGGRAHLTLTEAEDPLDAGLEIMASPPGKRLQVLSLLSGGEQALTALSLLFAVFLTKPAPICVLDEVDAPLDDANVDRFCRLIDELARQTRTRFLIITHHRMTMARVDRLFGVTMAERGVSKLVSVDLEAAEAMRESA